MQSIQPSSLMFSELGSKRGWKAAERVSENSMPTLCQPTNEAAIGSSSMPLEIPCSVCQEHQSRYTCPRCQIPYCSVGCYRDHKSGSNNGGTPCSEGFYKHRVASVLDLEAKEQKDNTHKILKDHYRSNRQKEEESEDILSDQLYELLQMLEETQDDNLTHQQVLALMSPALRADFQRDLNEGKLQEMILEKWHPWWRQQLGAGDDGLGGMSKPTGALPLSVTTLDERLMKIPKFTTLSRKPQSSRVLLYHLIDIMYAFCWTMRLYHGLPNVFLVTSSGKSSNHGAGGVDDDMAAVDAAATLMQASATLGNDARYESLEQVLIASTSASTRECPDGCNTEWTILVEDCAQIMTSHRFAGRALLETSDLFKAAIRHLKQETMDGSSSTSSHNDTILKLRQLRKKLEFFISWSQHAKSEFGVGVKDAIMRWAQEWNSDRLADGHVSADMEHLQISDSTVGHQERSVKSPSIVVVSSTT